jgi:iron(III) transport system substrate-binding protein
VQGRGWWVTGAWVAVVLVAAALSGCPRSGEQGPIEVVVSDNRQPGATAGATGDVAELARREGEVSWYTSLPEDAARAMLAGFATQHPSIRTRLVRDSTYEVIRRVRGELDSGKPQADVLHVLDVAPFAQLKWDGQLMQYRSSHEPSYDEHYRDPGYWTALRCVSLCIAYNPQRLAGAPVPRRWTDLLDPRLKGRIGLKDAQTAGSAYAEYYFLREKYGTDYWERMAAQRPHVYRTAEDSLQALVDGQVAVLSGAMDYSVTEAQAKGRPVRVVWPQDGSPMMLGPVAILLAAPHPNAARLLVDYLLSDAGQVLLRDQLGTYSARDGVAAPARSPALSQLRVMQPTGGWEAYARSQGMLQSEYSALFPAGTE